MRKIISLTATIVLLCVTVVFAKPGIGLEAGLYMSSPTFKDSGFTPNVSSKMGFKIGAIANVGFGKLSFQPGIFYVQKGFKANYIIATGERTINYIEIPLNIQYKIVEIPKIGHVFAGVGPYFGYALGGKDKVLGTEKDLKIGSDKLDDVKGSDVGININAGFKLGIGPLLRLQYSLGLTENAPVSASSYKNKGFCVSIGWLF